MGYVYYSAYNPQLSPSAMPTPLTLRPSLSQAQPSVKITDVSLTAPFQGAYRG